MHLRVQSVHIAKVLPKAWNSVWHLILSFLQNAKRELSAPYLTVKAIHRLIQNQAL